MDHDFYRRGIQYDAQHAHLTADIGLYEELAREIGGPILELACGTGRVSIPLAEAGNQVVGIDIEESMLSVARDKSTTDAEFIKADMRDFDLGRKFQLVILAFNSLGHLHERMEVEQCFHCVKAHLNEGGMFVVAMVNPVLELLTRKPDEERQVSTYKDPESENEIAVTERSAYDRASQTITSTWRYDIGDHEFENTLHLRVFYPQELQALLHYAGFKIHDVYGNFKKAKFDSDSPHQIYVVTV